MRINRIAVANVLQIVIGIAFLCLLEIPYRNTVLLGHNDFSTFYAGAKLARTPALYDHEIMRREVRSLWPDSGEGEVYLRAPFYAVLLKPLALLPYGTALVIFLCLTMGSFLWFVIRFSKQCPYLPVLAAFSVPIYLNLNGGADVPLLLPVIGVFVLLTGGVATSQPAWSWRSALSSFTCSYLSRSCCFSRKNGASSTAPRSEPSCSRSWVESA